VLGLSGDARKAPYCERALAGLYFENKCEGARASAWHAERIALNLASPKFLVVEDLREWLLKGLKVLLKIGQSHEGK
jgi:hypothetical protein